MNQHKNTKHSVKHAVNLSTHSAYIKLGLTLQSLTTLKFGELLLTANSIIIIVLLLLVVLILLLLQILVS